MTNYASYYYTRQGDKEINNLILKEKFKMKDRKERERIYPRPLLNV
jgi:hypothetical protein